MNYIRNISDYLKFKFYWKFPDIGLAAIILDQEGTQVYGRVKKGYAILLSIPLPKTGYRYKDIVKVSKTNNVQLYREDKIQEFKIQKIYRKSNIPSFVFELKLSKYQDYIQLQEEFIAFGHKILIPGFNKDKIGKWTRVYCSADNIEQVNVTLKKFSYCNKNCKIQNIEKV